MSEAVLGALITAVASVIVQILINANNNKKKKIDDAVRDALMEQRLTNIEHKLDVHNGYAAKFTTVTLAITDIKTMLAKQETDISWIKSSLKKE